MTHSNYWRFSFTVVIAPLLFATATCAYAADYPTKPIRMIVPSGAGSNLDYRARQLVPKLTQALGQQFVVDNRPGANSIIGTEIATRAPADGHTLFVGYHATVMNPFLYRKLPYDAGRQLAPVAGISHSWVALYVNAGVPAGSIKDLVALAKAKPDALTCSSAGNGSGQHLACHLFNTLNGIQVRHILYKETGQVFADLLGGQVSMYFDALTVPITFVKAGKLKALAISGPQRAVALPQLPTFQEAGLPAFELRFWSGMWAPAGTPSVAIDVLNREINNAIKAPEVQQQMADTGTVPLGGSPAEFAVFLKSQFDFWGKLIKDSGVQLQ